MKRVHGLDTWMMKTVSGMGPVGLKESLRIEVKDFLIPEACGGVIIHHTHCLHEGIANGRTNKTKASL